MVPLSQRELQIFNIFKDSIEKQTKFPTLREVASQLDISYSAARTYLERVIDKGYLVRVIPQPLKLGGGV